MHLLIILFSLFSAIADGSPISSRTCNVLNEVNSAMVGPFESTESVKVNPLIYKCIPYVKLSFQ